MRSLAAAEVVSVNNGRETTPRRSTRSGRVAVVAVLVGASLAAGCTSSNSSSKPAESTPQSSQAKTQAVAASADGNTDVVTALQGRFESLIRDTLPSVVLITNSSGLGSGVIYDNQGNIVTNAHVVGKDTTFKVTLSTGPQTLDAKLVGAFVPNDLAVIKLQNPPSGLKVAKYGDSSKLQVGDLVFAMGNPLGLSSSVTEGIVSALGRTVEEPPTDGSPAVIPSAIQTSAPINPGNSGGALVNLAGEVVGVPTLAALDPGSAGSGGAPAPGIGFAIPSNTAKNIADQLIKDGKVTNSGRASLGVGVVSVSDQSGGPAGAGIVQVVPGGPADSAGLKAGDVIVAMDDKKVTGANVLMDILAQLKPGQRVNVTVLGTDGKTRTVSVTLGELPG
jgi:S1-C subfamily serine protease